MRTTSIMLEDSGSEFRLLSLECLYWLNRIALIILDTFQSICIPKSEKLMTVTVKDRASKFSAVTEFSKTEYHCCWRTSFELGGWRGGKTLLYSASRIRRLKSEAWITTRMVAWACFFEARHLYVAWWSLQEYQSVLPLIELLRWLCLKWNKLSLPINVVRQFN